VAKGIIGPQGTARKPLKAFKDLPKRHRDFVKAYVRSGNAVEAYEAVGYKPNVPAAHKLLKLLNTYISKELSNYVKGTELGIVGLSLVKDLAFNSTNDMVRLNAAKELLSRALPEDPKEVHHIHQKPELTDEQLMGRIEDLRNKLLSSATVVPIRAIS
jgi:hypothetical protein